MDFFTILGGGGSSAVFPFFCWKEKGDCQLLSKKFTLWPEKSTSTSSESLSYLASLMIVMDYSSRRTRNALVCDHGVMFSVCFSRYLKAMVVDGSLELLIQPLVYSKYGPDLESVLLVRSFPSPLPPPKLHVFDFALLHLIHLHYF